MSVTRTKTGAKRHRVETRWFRPPLVVLQVEWLAKGYTLDWLYADMSSDVDYKYWRDAQVEDITEENT